jgi:hypothetical protein
LRERRATPGAESCGYASLLGGIRLGLAVRGGRLLRVGLGLLGIGLGLSTVRLGGVLGSRVRSGLVLDVAELGVVAVGVGHASLDKHYEVDNAQDPTAGVS